MKGNQHMTIDVTRYRCPAAPTPGNVGGGTHHLVPRGEVMVCDYCGKSRADLQEEISA